jgi:hypothetical protein
MTNDAASNLESVSTEELTEELRRRSRIFFMVMRPLADDREHGWSLAWGVNGPAKTDDRDENVERVFGLVDRAKFDILFGEKNIDDLT